MVLLLFRYLTCFLYKSLYKFLVSWSSFSSQFFNFFELQRKTALHHVKGIFLQYKKLGIGVWNCCAVSFKNWIYGSFSIAIRKQITVAKVATNCISYEWDVFALLVGILRLSLHTHILINLTQNKFKFNTYFFKILVDVNIEFDFSKLNKINLLSVVFLVIKNITGWNSQRF